MAGVHSGPDGADVHDADLREQVRREAARVADRLRGLGPARLARAGEAGRSPSNLAHDLSQRLADLAADSVGRDRRPVPRLADHAAGDQVDVLTHDLLREGDYAALAAALTYLTELRRAV